MGIICRANNAGPHCDSRAYDKIGENTFAVNNCNSNYLLDQRLSLFRFVSFEVDDKIAGSEMGNSMGIVSKLSQKHVWSRNLYCDYLLSEINNEPYRK